MDVVSMFASILIVAIGLGLIASSLQWVLQAFKQAKAEKPVDPETGRHVRITGHGDELFVVIGPDSPGWYRVRKTKGPREPFPVEAKDILAPKANL